MCKVSPPFEANYLWLILDRKVTVLGADVSAACFMTLIFTPIFPLTLNTACLKTPHMLLMRFYFALFWLSPLGCTTTLKKRIITPQSGRPLWTAHMFWTASHVIVEMDFLHFVKPLYFSQYKYWCFCIFISPSAREAPCICCTSKLFPVSWMIHEEGDVRRVFMYALDTCGWD